MKKIILAVVVVIALGGAGFVILKKDDAGDKALKSSTSSATSTESSAKATAKKACEVLTLEDAKGLIGSNAALLDGSGNQNLATTAGVTVDNCSYSADGATLGDMKQLTIQLQSGDSKGVKQAYENYKKEYPGDALPELGPSAFYSTVNKQAVVLNGDSWFFVGGGSMNGGNAANKELSIKAAEIATKKL